MTDLKPEPEEIIEAVEQVRDPTVDVSDYSFLDQVEKVHSAPSKKGNDGLANWIADLAVFKVGGETVVDQELVELADDMLGDQQGRNRSRMEGIVYNSDIRPGEKDSLVDNEVDGHGRLLKKVEDFYKATGREENLDQLYNIKDLSPDSGHGVVGIEEFGEAGYMLPDQNDTIYSKSENNQQTQGGENRMARKHDDPEDLGRQTTDARHSQEEMYENLSDLGTAVFDTLVEDYDLALDEAYDAVREAEHRVGDALEESEDNYDTVAQFASGLEEKIDEKLDSLDLDRFTDRAYDRFDTEMGTMERNRERFKDNNSEFF